jgi:PAS domain S-box-containing protein
METTGVRTPFMASERIVMICSAVVLLISGLVLFGWQFDIVVLKSVLPHYITMKANTAIGMGLLAITNFIFRSERLSPKSPFLRALGFSCSLTAFAIGLLTLIEYRYDVNFGIDEFFFTEIVTVKGLFPPGRLAPITALIFIAVGTAQLLIFNDRRKFYWASQVVTFVALVLPFQALVGYAFGVTYSFGNSFYTQMAVHTTALAILTCIGLLATRTERGWVEVVLSKTSGGAMARNLLIWAVAVPPLVQWIQITGEHLGLYGDDFGSVIRIVGNMVFFVSMVLKNALALQSGDLLKNQTEEKLRILAAEKQVEAAVALSEARLRAIFDAAFDAIVGMDHEGKISDWNPKAELMFGWKHEEVIGKSMSEMIIPHEHREAHQRGLHHFTQTGEGPILNQTIEVEALRRDGELFPIQLSVTPIKMGEVVLFTAFIADITLRKKNESDLISARQEALDAVRSKSAFLANMSHEIRTPLNGVIGMTDLLLDTPLDDQQKKYAKIVQDSGIGLLTIINDILDFSKIDAGKLSLEILDFSPSGVIEAQAELLATRASEKGLAILTFADPALASTLKGDPGRIGQILLNLISNAIKFTEQGRIKVSAIPLKTEEGICEVEFSVEDTGIGLSPEQVSRLFRPFVQADGSTARKYGGTGLGLSICKQLVDLMGGTIRMESVMGEGSRISFRIPLAVVESKSMQSQRAELSPEILNILVVDDDAIAREVLSHYLAAWKMNVTEAPNATIALKLLREAAGNGAPFDLAILDNRMPEIDGFALAKSIQADSVLAKLPLILATAFDRGNQETLAREAGFAQYLTKPVKQSALYDGIAIALGKVTPAVNPTPAELSAEKESLSHFRILVAEDNSVNQLLTLTQLKKLGYSAHAVANGLEVLTALESGRYDLILMDCQMPEMDGLEATRRIREIESERKSGHIPIVALTANAMKEDQESCIIAGMDDVVSKPTKRETLANVLALRLGQGKRSG